MKKIIFILLISVSSFSHAKYAGFSDSGGVMSGYVYTTKLAACGYAAQQITLLYPSITITGIGLGTSNICTGSLNGGAAAKFGWWYHDGLPDEPEAAVCTVGREFSAEVPMGTVSAPDMDYPININGCRVSVTEFEGCQSNPSTGALQCKFRLKEHQAAPVGESQTPLAEPIVEPKSEKIPPHNPAQGQGCPAGTVNLGIDSTGGSICGGSGTSPSTPAKTEVKQPPVTTQNPDGGNTKTDVTTRTNSDGSTTTTTKTTTTGADGKVTTKEGSVTGSKPTGAGGSGGGSGKDDSSDDKKDDFCAKHPELNACKNSSVSGECESTACEGDAIQCSILRQQRKTYCELTKPDAMSELGQQIMSGNDPLKSTFPTKENARLVEIPQLNKNGFLGAGSCFPDVSFSLQGQQFTLPISKLCDYLIVFRGVIMLMASLASWKIISRSILG